mmetsp:Transcript_6247/g.7596  ORF Transcript_6247/g.7596 Transcript_6247/m.7596 type:complete len:148 (-) Transcript_6247:201-644(-)
MLPKTVSKTAVVNGVKTQVIVTFFADRLFILVSQLNKLGCLLEGQRDASIKHPMPLGKQSTFSVEVILGNREDMLSRVLVRQMLEIAKKKGDGVKARWAELPLLVGLSLKSGKVTGSCPSENHSFNEDSQVTIKEVLELFEQCLDNY